MKLFYKIVNLNEKINFWNLDFEVTLRQDTNEYEWSAG